MSKTQVVTKKMALYPLGDKDEVARVYTYIRDGMYAQNRAYNILISHVYQAIYTGKSNEEIKEIYRLGGRISTSKKGSLYDPEQITFPKGLPTAASVTQRVRNDIAQATTKGLFKGKVALSNRKLRDPLLIEKQQFSFYHNYENDDEFISVIDNKEIPELYMKFVNGINFKVIFGSPRKCQSLIALFKSIFQGECECCGSSIQFDKSGRKIILNLSVKMPVQQLELDEDIVVGVRFSNSTPIVCATNVSGNRALAVGDTQVLLDEKARIRDMRERCQIRMRYTNGGHGRTKKMRQYKQLQEKEKNFAKTYNHILSRRIVDYARKTNAKYINMEDMKDLYREDEFVLKNYNYYQLYSDVAYKAALLGMELRLVDRIPSNEMAEGKTDEDYAVMIAKMEETRTFNKAPNNNKTKENDTDVEKEDKR